MPDLWFWLLLGVVNAGLVVAVWREAERRTERRWSDAVSRREAKDAADRQEAFANGRAYERERALNIAAATEADRKATITRNRSEAQKRRYAKANGSPEVTP
jgi:hypothetical protein